MRDDRLRIEQLPHMEVRPPIRRGDLHSVSEEDVSIVSIIDGDFYQSLAVSPKEVLAVMRRGVTVVGGASMGALRAAELSPYGMIGVGTIFRWYRTGRVTRDDDVAIMYASQAPEYRTLTVPMVNVIWVLEQGKTTGWLSRRSHRRVLVAARNTHWTKRNWPTILGRARLNGPERDAVMDFISVPDHDLKRLDALSVVQYTEETLAQWLVPTGPISPLTPARRPS
jgi:hypothetical protein